jgi:hypothetical protein
MIQSQPSREAALNALQNLTPLLSNLIVSTMICKVKSAQLTDTQIGSGILCVLHQALDRLLNDDDEALRNGASEIVRKALAISSPICRDRADQLWCKWAAEYISTLDTERSKPWIDWLQAQADGLKREGQEAVPLSTTPPAPIQPGSSNLFTVEPANLFRDPLADAHRARAIIEAASKLRS